MSDRHPFLARPVTRRQYLIGASALLGAAVLAACGEAAAPASSSAAPAAPASSAAASSAPASASAAASSSAASVAPSASAAASAVASSSGSALAKPASPVAVTQMTNWFAEWSHGGLYAATAEGDYTKVNLNMKTNQGGPGLSTTTLLGTGKVDFAMVQADDILLARQEGIPLVMVFGTFQTNPQGLMYHSENPVKDFADLNGRKVYVSGAASFWQYLAQKYKLDKVQQLNYTGQLGLFMADPTAVFQCYVTDEPLIATKQGAKVGTLLNADGGYNPYANAMTTTEQMIKDKPDVVQAAVTAWLAGWKSFFADPKPAMPLIKADNKDYDTDLGIQSVAIGKPMVMGPSSDPKVVGALSADRMKALHDQMRQTGMLKKDIDVATTFNSTFITAAQKAAA